MMTVRSYMLRIISGFLIVAVCLPAVTQASVEVYEVYEDTPVIIEESRPAGWIDLLAGLTVLSLFGACGWYSICYPVWHSLTPIVPVYSPAPVVVRPVVSVPVYRPVVYRQPTRIIVHRR